MRRPRGRSFPATAASQPDGVDYVLGRSLLLAGHRGDGVRRVLERMVARARVRRCVARPGLPPQRSRSVCSSVRGARELVAGARARSRTRGRWRSSTGSRSSRDGAPRGEAWSAPSRARRRGLRSRRSSGSPTSLRPSWSSLPGSMRSAVDQDTFRRFAAESRETLERSGMALTIEQLHCAEACSRSAPAGSKTRLHLHRLRRACRRHGCLRPRRAAGAGSRPRTLVRLGRAEEAEAVLGAWEARGVPREVWPQRRLPPGAAACSPTTTASSSRSRTRSNVTARSRRVRRGADASLPRRAAPTQGPPGRGPTRAPGCPRDLRAARGGALGRARARRSSGRAGRRLRRRDESRATS